MTAYAKQNGVYQLVTEIWSKEQGYTVPVEAAYQKQNGAYVLIYQRGESGGGTDPQDDLDYIILLNDSVSTSTKFRETYENIWGNGDDRDLNGEIIAGSVISSGFSGIGYIFMESKCVKMPAYIPQLNVDDTWLLSKGITISGSTSNIIRRAINPISGSGNNDYPVITQDVYDNINLYLKSNTVGINSSERSTNNFSNSEFDSNAVHINRDKRVDNLGGLKVFHRKVGYPELEWRVEVDVNYNITFYHAESGLSRTINKTIKFRTYNN